MKHHTRFTLAALAFVTFTTFSQLADRDTALPEIGKPMPDFTLDVHYFKTKSVSMKDFKGKWLFLDFWFEVCGACIQSFPSVNTHYKEFKDDLTWLMVGLNSHRYKGTQALYEKLRVKKNLEMPVAYDSVLVNKWNVHSYPHIIIVDPAGIVHSITSGRDLTTEKIRQLIKGDSVKFYPKDVVESPKSVLKSGINNYKPERILYHSVLTQWDGERQSIGFDLNRYVNEKIYLLRTYDFSMIPLFGLYNQAYFGRWRWYVGQPSMYGNIYPEPILELKDSSLFQYDYNIEVGKGLYNYSLKVPQNEISRETIMRYMQQDLKRYFKYEAIVEEREMPVWLLTATADAKEKLKSKGSESFVTPGNVAAGFTMVNHPAEDLLHYVKFYIEELDLKTQFIDKTGLTGNIDITLDADMTNMDDVRKALQNEGLDLIRGKKKMKVLIIRDALD